MPSTIFKSIDSVVLRKVGSLIIQIILLTLMISGWRGVSRERELLMEKNQYFLKLYEDKDLTPEEREFLQTRIGDVDYFLSHKRPFLVDKCLAFFGGVVYTMWMFSFPIWVVKKKTKEP